MSEYGKYTVTFPANVDADGEALEVVLREAVTVGEILHDTKGRAWTVTGVGETGMVVIAGSWTLAGECWTKQSE